jgi:26S proteasome regulatory subunit N4
MFFLPHFVMHAAYSYIIGKRNDLRDVIRKLENRMLALHAFVKQHPEAAAAAAEAAKAARNQPGAQDDEKAVHAKPTPAALSVAMDEQKTKQHVVSDSAIPQQPQIAVLEAFYVVDNVFDSSPASLAGLKIGDHIMQFGTVTKANQKPDSLPKVVGASIGKPLPVKVYRNGEGMLNLQLTPQQWSGRGLLGCHLQPIK